MNFVIVFLGAGLGGALRHGVNLLALRVVGVGFPVGTLTINVLGSLLMGLAVGWFAARGELGATWRLLVTTGVLGGFTTFSAFSLEVVLLYERGALGLALLYVLASVGLSIAALALGLGLTR